jgi:tetratricopeptide (TPR) repeat protein
MKNFYAFLLLAGLMSPVFAAKNDATDFVARAQKAFETKHYKKCVALTEKALDREPSLADAYYWKGRGLEAMGKTLEAANEYHAALLARPDFAEAREGLTRVSTALGTTDSTGVSRE